ncbi:MAG: hypothetical protein WCF84_27325 [Anaerolineae bacterium]
MHLEEFPRPDEDNGLGIHFGLDLRPIALETFVQRMSDLQIKWCLIPHTDDQQLARAAQYIGAAGIMPLSRWICHIDQNLLDFVQFVRVLDQLGLPAYIQIFNEPSDEREWRDNVYKPRAFISRWCDHAARVAEAGGLPGLQVLHTEELRAILTELKSRNASKVIEQMWFCPHPYGSNHPPDYPYDNRNQLDRPAATLANDDMTVLQFLEFAPIFEAELGFVPPFIAGEGGWQYGNAEDGRYPRIADNTHAIYHAALFDWFRIGKLSNGEPLPDYLFAFCPWILFGAEADAWWSSTSGTRQKTIDTIQATPPFVRQFGHHQPTLSHYVLFGEPTETQRARLLLAQSYLTRFNITFGFSVQEARRARQVTIIGDQNVVGWDAEAEIKQAGCRIERLIGDTNALTIILNDRLTRNIEFG